MNNMEDCVKKMPKQTFTSNLQVYRFIYEWKIQNFSYYTPGTIESPKFSSGSSELNDQWSLKVTFKNTQDLTFGSSSTSTDANNASICLRSFNKDSQLFTKCKLIAQNYQKTIEHCFKTSFDQIIFDSIMLKSSPAAMFGSALRPLDDTLTISCELTIATETNNNLEYESMNFEIARQKLSLDYEQLLLNEKSADISIKVGEKTFRAIKGILSARSPVFSAMFEHQGFKENKESQVVINDIDEDVFEQFLHFIYTDRAPKLNELSAGLLAAAEKYQVDRLKNLCEASIAKGISPENAADALVLAHKFNADQLKETCLKFFKNNLRKIVLTEGFKTNKKLHAEIFASSVIEALAGI